MTNAHDTQLLKEYIDSVITEEVGGSPDADQAFKRIFVQPFTDVGSTAVAVTAQAANRGVRSFERFIGRTWNIFVPQSLLPWLGSRIEDIDKKQDHYEQLIMSKYGEVLQRNDRSLFTTDGAIFSLMYAPQAFLNAYMVYRGPKAAFNLIKTFTAQRSFSHGRQGLIDKLYRMVFKESSNHDGTLLLERISETQAQHLLEKYFSTSEGQAFLQVLSSERKDAHRIFDDFIGSMTTLINELKGIESLEALVSLVGDKNMSAVVGKLEPPAKGILIDDAKTQLMGKVKEFLHTKARELQFVPELSNRVLQLTKKL